MCGSAKMFVGERLRLSSGMLQKVSFFDSSQYGFLAIFALYWRVLRTVLCRCTPATEPPLEPHISKGSMMYVTNTVVN